MQIFANRENFSITILCLPDHILADYLAESLMDIFANPFKNQQDSNAARVTQRFDGESLARSI